MKYSVSDDDLIELWTELRYLMQLTEMDVIKSIKTTNKSAGVRSRECLRIVTKKSRLLTKLLLQRRKEIDINKQAKRNGKPNS